MIRKTCLMLLLVASAAHANDLAVGSMRFTLGSPQSQVMAAIADGFRVVPVSGDQGLVFLAERGASDSKILGSLQFKGGRLTMVQRRWGQFSSDADPHEVGSALFGAIESATRASGPAASITTETQRIPGVLFMTTTFRFAGRNVSVLTTEGSEKDGGKQVSIEEWISE
jgi:hypothetical protein